MIGSDPEILFSDNYGFIEASHVLREFRIRGLGLDGICAVGELRPTPGETGDIAAFNCKSLMHMICKQAADRDIKVHAGAMRWSQPIGGHIHFDKTFVTNLGYVVNVLDALIGRPLIEIGKPETLKRIELTPYGKLSSTQHHYGRTEYRTPPSWLWNPEITGAVLKIADKITQNENIKINEDILDIPGYNEEFSDEYIDKLTQTIQALVPDDYDVCAFCMDLKTKKRYSTQNVIGNWISNMNYDKRYSYINNIVFSIDDYLDKLKQYLEENNNLNSEHNVFIYGTKLSATDTHKILVSKPLHVDYIYGYPVVFGAKPKAKNRIRNEFSIGLPYLLRKDVEKCAIVVQEIINRYTETLPKKYSPDWEKTYVPPFIEYHVPCAYCEELIYRDNASSAYDGDNAFPDESNLLMLCSTCFDNNAIYCDECKQAFLDENGLHQVIDNRGKTVSFCLNCLQDGAFKCQECGTNYILSFISDIFENCCIYCEELFVKCEECNTIRYKENSNMCDICNLCWQCCTCKIEEA